MSFATPIAFALAALAIPIIVFYVLKVRMRRLPVSTNLFWRQLYDEKPPRSIWQNLRHLLSLLAQLAFLGMLVMAIADPYLPWQLRNARRVVLVLDNSASMQGTDVGENRFEAARSFALDLITGLRERDEVAVVVAGETPEVAVGMTGHIPTLRRTIQSIEVSDNSTSLQSAIRLGEKLVGKHPYGEIIVLTDGCLEPTEVQAVQPLLATTKVSDDASTDLAQAIDDELSNNETQASVRFELFGTKARNVGITQFQVRRSLSDPLGYEILAVVMNAGDQPIRCRLEITLDDAPVDVVPLRLSAGETWRRSFEKTSIEGGTLVAKLTRIEPNNQPESEGSADKTLVNQLSVDDIAWAILPERSRQKVLLVSSRNLFLQKVFEVNPLVDLTIVDQFPQAWPEDTLTVLHQKVPATLPDGDVFVLDPVEDCSLWKLKGEIDDPIITQQADDSALMTHIRLDNVVLPKAPRVDFNNDVEMLAGTVSGDPIYALVRRPEGKCLVLLVNLEQSDLAFRTSFPIMVTNALNWYAGESGQLQPALPTGTIVSVPMPEESQGRNWQLSSPSGNLVPITITSSGDACTIGPFEQSGVWTFGELGPDSKQTLEPHKRFAVNLANARETDLVPVESLVSANDKAASASRWLTRPIWFYLAMLAGLFAGIEWFLYQRRFIS